MRMGRLVPSWIACSVLSACHALVLPEPAPRVPEPSVLSVEPSQVDLGAISQCDLPVSMAVRLRNETRQVVVIQSAVSTCACTTTDLRPGLELNPGDEQEFRIRLEPWGEGRKQQFVRLVAAGGIPLGRVAINYSIRSPLRARPSGVSRELNPEGEFLVESPSRTPFRVVSFDPPVASVRHDEALSAQVVRVDWASIDALARVEQVSPLVTRGADGGWTSLVLVVHTDLPDCPELFLLVRNTGRHG